MSTASAANSPEDPQVAKYRLEVEYLRRQIEKLSFEIRELQGEGAWERRLKRYLPLISGLLAVVGFWFGIVQYVRAESLSREQRTKSDSERLTQQQQAEQARLDQQRTADDLFRKELTRETAKPLWDKQLSLYLEAVENAAVVATTHDEAKRVAAEARFWVLYWGPLAAVEDVGLTKQESAAVEAAMVQFGKELEKKPTERDPSQTKVLALDLAHAVRSAVAPSFNVAAADLRDLRTKK